MTKRIDGALEPGGHGRPACRGTAQPWIGIPAWTAAAFGLPRLWISPRFLGAPDILGVRAAEASSGSDRNNARGTRAAVPKSNARSCARDASDKSTTFIEFDSSPSLLQNPQETKN